MTPVSDEKALKDEHGHEWPARLLIRDTKIHDDLGGLGQRIYTTAGAGYKKVEYVRADLLRPSSAVAEAAGEKDLEVYALLHAAMSWVRSDTESPSAKAILAQYEQLCADCAPSPADQLKPRQVSLIEQARALGLATSPALGERK